MATLQNKFFTRNKHWADSKLAAAPHYFTKLAKTQSPQAFWLGCCDSRVTPTEILGMPLGELFIQTTVANQVGPKNNAVTSALEYAVTTLKVEHIIVCGHTHCGGVAAAINGAATGNLQLWLTPLRDLYLAQRHNIIATDHSIELSKLNVKHQVATISVLDFVRNAHQTIHIHGWIFKIEEGLLEDVYSTAPQPL